MPFFFKKFFLLFLKIACWIPNEMVSISFWCSFRIISGFILLLPPTRSPSPVPSIVESSFKILVNLFLLFFWTYFLFWKKKFFYFSIFFLLFIMKVLNPEQPMETMDWSVITNWGVDWLFSFPIPNLPSSPHPNE